MRDLAEFVKESLTSVGRASIMTEILDISKLNPGEVKRVEQSYTVSSPRLDNVVSAVFGLSRRLATEAISKGIVFVDGVSVTKTDYRLSDNQKLVLRGKGKAIYLGEHGQSRKGKVYIKVDKYV